MAAAFHRAGWRTTAHRLDMTWDCGVRRGETPPERASGGWLNACRPITARPAAPRAVSAKQPVRSERPR